MVLRRGLKLKESEIELMIGHFLNTVKGIAFKKTNVAGYMANGRWRKHRNPYAISGGPDYDIWYRGMYLGLEVKTETGKQSESQKKFEGYITLKGGAKYYVVRSVDDAQKIVNAFRSAVDKICLHDNSERLG